MLSLPRQLSFDLAPPEVSPASDWCQRWRDGRPRWRHRSEGGFDAAQYEVAPVDDRTAKAYVERHHYARSYVASRLRYGLWDRRGALLGVAVLSVPVRRAVLTGPFPELEPFTESLELGRFVLADRVPANAESWFLGRVFRLAAREGVRGLVSFSDPVARRDAAGRLVFPGHLGVIYQASNAIYAGRGTARTLLVLPDGRVLNERALAKLRSLDTGHAYVEELLRAFGAPPRRGAPTAEWLPRAVAAAGVRRLRHPGNHRYLFRLGDRAAKRAVLVALPSAPYPKRVDRPTAAAAERGGLVECELARKHSEETMHPAIPSTLRLLPLPCPPQLAEAVGYRGASRFVAFAWSPAGDEAIYDDGYASGTGEWTAYLAFVCHPVVRPLLADAQLGSSDREASHWLLADLAEGRLYLGPRLEVRRFLRAANAPATPPPTATQSAPAERLEDLLEELRTGVFAERFEEVALDEAELRRQVAARMARQDRLVARLMAWLDRRTRPSPGA